MTDTRNLTNPSTVIFLIGNKADLESTREVTYEEAKQFADENGLMFVEASAMRYIFSYFVFFLLYIQWKKKHVFYSGQNVEEAFLETAKKIYQNIQDGRLDLNASESGVQHKPSQPGRTQLVNENLTNKDNCSC